MKRFRLRFGLFSLLAMPVMFALGWWARDRNYNRDVYVAAEQIAQQAGGVYIPELGIIFHGGNDLAKRMQAMSPEAKVEMQRRLAYYEDVMEPEVEPPRPSLWDSITSFLGVSDNDEALDDPEVIQIGSSPDDASESSQNESTIQNRIEAFRRMQRNGSFETPRDSAPND